MTFRPEDSPEFRAKVDARRSARMAAVDALPQGVRELVHDYGLNTVRALLDLGVKEPRHIRHVVETVLNEFSPTRGSYSNQGVRTQLLNGVKDAPDLTEIAAISNAMLPASEGGPRKH